MIYNLAMENKKNITYDEILTAVETLGLGNSATIDEIKKAYKELAKKFHPDTGNQSSDSEKFIEVSFSYRILMAYASSFKIDFSEEAFLKSFPEERIRRRFFSDPLWGPGKGKEDGS